MAPRSSLKSLPKEVLAEVDKLIRDNHTIDEILAHLRSLDAGISRSAIGRYKQNAEKSMQRTKEIREIAGVWAHKLGEDPESDVGRLLLQMLQTQLWVTLANMGEKDVDSTDPKQLALMARSIKDIEMAGKLSLDNEERIRKAALEEAAKAAESVVRERGLSDEDAEILRAKILGVQDAGG